jgi:hypothetical protein
MPQTNPQIQQIKNLMYQVKNSQNPQMILQNIIMQNPSMQNVLNLMRLNNASPQQIAQLLAQQKGVDLNNLIMELQS